MSRLLVAMSIGPVQGFIAASRKTRDLWFGSFILSELSKAAAREVQLSGGELIFPCPESEKSLERGSEWSVANIILAVKDGGDPFEFSEKIRESVQECWKYYCSQAYDLASIYIDKEIWDSQLEDVIEFYSSWVDFPEDSEYSSKRQRLMYILGGRKNCRNFSQRTGKYGVEKSSLDGARESVLKQGARGSTSLKLGVGEQLDLPGLVKRLSGGNRRFPSVTRVACDSWIRRAATEAREEFKALSDVCEELAEKDIIVRLKGDSLQGGMDIFPFEGSCVYPGRYGAIFQESGCTPQETEYYSKILENLVGKIQKKIGSPGTNCAVIAADGDRMGKAISSITNIRDHQAFSVALSQFAVKTGEIVAEYHGTCIYSGGDDVFAMVPVDGCLDCARELHYEFSRILADAGFGEKKLTLSVGIAICHFLESLEDILSFAREAERLAKGTDRNGLAVVARTRSNAPIAVREQWTDDEYSLDRRLGKWHTLFETNVLPQKLPYDLRELTVNYYNWEKEDELSGAISAHISHVFAQKGIKAEKVPDLVKRIEELDSVHALENLAEELLLAQRVWCSEAQERR